MEILCIDYWVKKCWLAYSLIWISFAYKNILTKDIFLELENIIKKEKITKIVVWLAKNNDQTDSEQTLRTYAFIKKLSDFLIKNNFNINIDTQDEKLSSEEARFIAREQSRGEWEHIDDIAAYVILRDYLAKK